MIEFSDSSWKYCPDTDRSTGSYIIFYQGGPTDQGTHVPGPVYQSSAESEYNAACNTVTTLSNLRMLIQEFLNKDSDIVSKEAPIIILHSKSDVCMANNVRDTNKKRHISRRVHLVRNSEK